MISPKITFEYPENFKRIEKNLKSCLEFIGIEYFHDVEIFVVSKEYLFENLVDAETKQLISDGFQVGGTYYTTSESNLNRIYLNFDALNSPIPKILSRTPLISFRIIKILSHELAHHLIATKKEPFTEAIAEVEEETVAEKFAEKIVSDYEQKRKNWNWIYKDLASWYFNFGLADCKLNKFESAKKHLYLAFLMDSKNESISEWFWFAKHKAENNIQSEKSISITTP